MVSKALSPMGLKRICTSCGTRFYDLNKRPIICPNCGTEFTGDIKLKSRRGRLPADPKKEEQQKAVVAEVEEDEILGDEELEVVSLEDVEEDSDDEDDEAIKLEDDNLSDLEDFDDEDLDEELEEEAALDEEES